MNLSQYKRRDWKRASIKDHFSAVSDVSQKIISDREQKRQQGVTDDCLNYDAEVQLMTRLMNNRSYSNNFACTVKAAAIASAEAVLQDPFILKMRRQWDVVSKNKGDLHTVAKTAQRHMVRQIAKHDFYDEYDRVTDVVIINQKPRVDAKGVKRILRGSMASSVNPQSSNKHRITGSTQFETLKMNMHSKSAISNDIEWFGVQWHENFHGMEAIYARHNVMTMGRKRFANDNDAQLLISKDLVRMNADFRDVAYDTYRASPSERLARMGQEAFVQRMMAEQFVMG
jgi:hypothetical protein